MRIYYKIDPREERLPKWAQEHMNALRNSILTMQRALEQDISNSNTFLKTEHSVEDEALGKSPRVVFKTNNDRPWLNEFQVHIEDDTLRIFAATTMIIKPTSSNMLQIRMEDRR